MFDQEFINILCSCESMKQLCDTIEILKERCVLKENEVSILKTLTDEIETYGITDIESKFQNGEEISKYSSLELDDKIETYVKKRIDQEVADLFKSGDVYDSQKINYYFNGYVENINSSIDETIFSDDMFITNIDNTISTNSDNIDEISGGLRPGYITTLVGDNGVFKSLWAINIVYTAIVNATNVMYLSLGNDKRTVAKRLMTRHSCNERFSEGISYEAMHNSNNFGSVSNIVNNFIENYSRNIIIYDESDLKIASVASLRRLIALAQKYFLEETASGIDLIVIDDFTYMSLSKNGKVTRNRSTVIDEYYRYLKGESRNILGTNYACSVLCTHQHRGDGSTDLIKGYEYNLSYISEPIVLCSDNVFTIYGSTLANTKVARCKVIKTAYGELMNHSDTIAIDSDKWYMSFDDKSIAEARTLCKLKDEQIKELKEEVECLKEQRDNQAQALEQYSNQENEDMDISLGRGIISDEEARELRKQTSIVNDKEGKIGGDDHE